MSARVAPASHSHRRRDALTGEWVLVSPHRARRPWQGRVETADVRPRDAYDPDCYLCPGNARADGTRNPAYAGVHVFDNDFPALGATTAADGHDDDELFASAGETGRCRVVCYSPRHDLSLGDLAPAQIADVVDVWRSEYEALGSDPAIAHVQIFENRGEMMGCSNPHPHGQIWAQSSVPLVVEREDARQREHLARHGRKLLADYVVEELRRAERIVCANDAAVVVVPFWATWPFETLLVPRRPVPHLGALDDATRDGIAALLGETTRRYDALFGVPFPYSAGVHQAPTDGRPVDAWHLHWHFLPPLLRSATVRKFLVGYEMLAEPQRDLTPEKAAERLRGVSST